MDEQQNQQQQYTEEEASAALMLMLLAGGAATPTTEHSHSGAESASDSEDEARRLVAEEETQEGEEELDEDLAEYLGGAYSLDSLLGRMTNVALTTLQEQSGRAEDSRLRQRLQPFVDAGEVHSSQYHENMRRVWASSGTRTPTQQQSREKNNHASRMSRIRLRNSMQNLRVEAQRLDEENTARRLKKAVLLGYVQLGYVQLLHRHLHASPWQSGRSVAEVKRDYGLGEC